MQHLGGSTWGRHTKFWFLSYSSRIFGGVQWGTEEERVPYCGLFTKLKVLCVISSWQRKEKLCFISWVKQAQPNTLAVLLHVVDVLLMNIHAELQVKQLPYSVENSTLWSFFEICCLCCCLVCTKVSLCKIRFGFPVLLYQLIRVGTILVQ